MGKSLGRYQTEGIPEYLARHYWWAYLSPRGVWFFDRHWVINLILFGHYRRILNEVLKRYTARHAACTLQLTCAYGALTPALVRAAPDQRLHVMDVARIQLAATRDKLSSPAPVSMAQMDAESLAYATNSFDTVIIFFLLHELPEEARTRILAEVMRVLRPGGRLLIAEYGRNRGRHLLHRCAPLRRLQERLEPFLSGFWHSDLDALLQSSAANQHKAVYLESETELLGGYYRVAEYHV